MRKIIFVLCNLSIISSYCLASSPQTTSTFKVLAKLEKGCGLSYSEQKIDFGQQPAISQAKIKSSITNTASTWNIKCTEKLPVTISFDGGQNFLNNTRRMKNSSSSDYVVYKLYTSNSLNNEYLAGKSYPLNPTSSINSVLDFSIHGVADLNNNNQPRSAGIYKDTVSILITW
jgi:spore coat protein U-like protein